MKETDIKDLELETLRNFYETWKHFHNINVAGTTDRAKEEAAQDLVAAKHMVEEVQRPRILLLDS